MVINFRDLPKLQNEMILEMTPKCYYAHYDGVKELPKEVGGMWSYIWRMLPHNKPEKGIMILEDITKSPGRFRHLDKNKVPDIEDFLKIMESIAHFHGVWWQIVDDLRGKNIYLRRTIQSMSPPPFLCKVCQVEKKAGNQTRNK